MATIRELRARFSAEVRGMKKVFQDLQKDLKYLASESDDVADSMGDDFQEAADEISKSGDKIEKEVKENLDNIEKETKGTTQSMKDRFNDFSLTTAKYMQKTGDSLISFGKGMKTVSDKATSAGKSLTKKITMPAVGAASALAGIALKKGFDRLIGIDTARAKLKGLGHDAEGVEKIMDSALESVKGTSFGMDEAATTAANAVAAGVKEGKELTKYLSLTGDAAAIAGSSMSEMGSILNKVKTSNKAYNGELQQLSDRGLPVYQWLAEEAGVAEDAVFDLAKEGKISSEMLMNAIENNIGGAAKKMGEESFSAGIANMWAAVGRLGASFLDAGGKGGGFFSKLKPMIADFTKRIDSMGSYAEKAGEKFGEMFTGFIDKIKSVKSWFDDLSPTMQGFIKKGALIGTVVAVGIGPALWALGSLGGVIANVSIGLGTFLKFMSKVITPFKRVAPVAAEAGKSVGLLGRMLGLLTGPVGIIIGIIAVLATGFVLLYKRSDSFRAGVHKLIEKLKELGGKALEGLKKGVGAVVDFFKEQGKILQNFWKENGSTTIKAAENIGKVATTFFSGILKVIQFVMPLAFAIIRMVWSNIKGVIAGALKIIMGLVQVFSGLFTGDFKKMWEGIKNIFFGALQFIWNYVQLMFWGKMLKGILSLGKLLINAFRNSWSNILKIVSKFVKSIVDFIRNRFTNARDFISNIHSIIREIVRLAWDNIRKRITDSATSIFNRVRDTFTNLRNRIRDIFRDIYNNVRNRFNNIVDRAKELPQRIGDGIGKMAGKVTAGITKVINKMTSTLGKGVNGVISGVNWVLERLNVETRVKPWPVPQYAKGTDGHPQDGPAIVGDGKGSNAGQELIQTPDGQTYLSPARPTVVHLPKGTHVWSAQETEAILNSMPQYAWGTIKKVAKKAKGAAKGSLKKVGNVVKKGASAVKDTALDIFEYISNPSKLLNKALESLGVYSSGEKDFIGDIARGGFKMVKDGAIEYIKKKISDFGSSVPSAGSGVQRWTGIASRALMMTGQFSAANLKRLLYQMETESGGNPRAINLWDINAKRGTPSKGLMQVIDPTFRAYAMPGFNTNIWDPLSNILASIRYAVSRYGSLARAYRGVGYADGGIVRNKQLAWIAEGGWAESIISHDPAKRVSQRAIWEQTGRELGFDTDNQEVISLLERIAAAVEAGKDLSIIMNDRLVGELVAPFVKNKLENDRMRKNRGRGFA